MNDSAKSRFIVLQVVRLTGIVLGIFGLAILAGKIELPRIAGAMLVIVGVIDAFVAPAILARRWKKPNP